jgi:hypothetical protein
LFCRLAEISSHGVLGLLQHYRHKADVAPGVSDVRTWVKSRHP